MPESETDLARRLLKKVLNFDEPWTPDMRLRIATVSQAYASLAVVDELRRLNDSRDQFNTAMLEFFERLSERSSEGPSGDGATAQVVEKEGEPGGRAD
jgi:hypothetical protein